MRDPDHVAADSAFGAGYEEGYADGYAAGKATVIAANKRDALVAASRSLAEALNANDVPAEAMIMAAHDRAVAPDA